MLEQKTKRPMRPFVDNKKVDTKEFELPETTFVSDIDTQVFQGIVLQSLSQIPGISLAEGNFIHSIFGKSSPEVGCGIHSARDCTNQSVNIKIEVNIRYGLSIPEKAEEIQSKVVEEITRLTGLRVSGVHVVFKNIISPNQAEQALSNWDRLIREPALLSKQDQDYTDDF